MTFDEHCEAAQIFKSIKSTLRITLDILDNPLTDKSMLLQDLYHDIEDISSKYNCDYKSNLGKELETEHYNYKSNKELNNE